jgi:large subunit ribosomal protein L25
MPDIKLLAETGRPRGSRAAGRLRAAGKIPGVVYGHGSEPTPVAVDGRALRAALSTDAGLNALLNLDLGDGEKLAMAKDVQRHPVRGTVTHVDFLIVSRDEVVTADVSIVLVGDAVEVHRADGVVSHELFTLTIHAKPAAIPNQIEVDVSGMQIGDAIRVADLKLPAGVSTEVDGEAPIAVAQGPQALEVEEPTEEAAEGAAEAAAEGGGEAAPAEGGEAPAEGAAAES